MSDHADEPEAAAAGKKKMLEGHARGAQGKRRKHVERGVNPANASGISFEDLQRSAETDVGEDPAEDELADNVTFGHKMMYPAEPDWNIISDDFADEDLASLLRGDGKQKIDLVVPCTC